MENSVRYWGKLVFLVLSLFLFPELSWPQGVTYHGRLLNSSGSVVTASTVHFLVEIRTPGNEDCLMYSETQTKDLSATAGAFAITLNDGTGTRNDSSGLSFAGVFANKGTVTFPGGSCAVGTTRSFAITDGRRVRTYFNDGTFAGWESFPDESMNFAPMAVESSQVSGYKAANLLRADVGTTVPELTGPDVTELLNLVTGASTLYAPKSTAAGISLPTYAGSPTTPAAGSIWYDSGSGAIKFYNGTSAQTLGTSGSASSGTAGSPGLTFSTDTDTGIYNPGANSIGFSAGGTQIFNMSTTTFASPTTGGALITSGNGTAAAPAFSFTGDADTGWFRPAADTLAASTAGTEKVRIDSSGNVGIGTTSPLTKLDVSGASTTGGRLTISNSNTAILSGDKLGSLEFYTYDTSLSAGVGSKIESIAEDAGAAFGLKFSARDNSGYYGVINLSSSGAVGFWDATPQSDTIAIDSSNARSILMTRHPLNNTAGNNLTIQAGGTGGSSTNKIGGNLVLSSGIATGNGGSDIVFNAVKANQGAGTTDRTPAEVMRIKDGNVGIGTTSPSEKLEVSGGIKVGTQTTRTTTTNRGQLSQGSTYITTTNANTTLDMNNGNIQELSTFLCDGAKTITLSNLKDGAAYTVLISGAAAHSGICIFSAGGFTFKASGGNTTPTASHDVLFTFAVINTTVVYNMIDNLQ